VSLAIIEMVAHMGMAYDELVFPKDNFYAQKKHKNTPSFNADFWTYSPNHSLC
jgi:hypothetical protein